MRRAVASILQAFLRTDRNISLRPWGRRCLADHHLRTWCPPNKPPRVSSGSGESWFDPRRGNSQRDGMFGPIALWLSRTVCEYVSEYSRSPISGRRRRVGVARTQPPRATDRKSTRLNSSHLVISYAVFCLKKKKKKM